MNLAKLMSALVAFVRQAIADWDHTGDRHWGICQMAADAFDLWEENDCFPTWLSVVVEHECTAYDETRETVDA